MFNKFPEGFGLKKKEEIFMVKKLES